MLIKECSRKNTLNRVSLMNEVKENVKITFTKLDADKTYIDDVIVSGFGRYGD
jgi:hypothetical protein